MNLKPTTASPARAFRAGIFAIVLATGLMVDKRCVAASSVIASQTPPAPLTTEWQQEQPNEMDVFIPFGEVQPNPLPEIFQFGALQVRPHADYRFSYGNGVQSDPGNQQATVIQEISPGVLMDLGTRWSLDYTPTIRLYSNNQFQNTVDNSVSLTGGTEYEDWMFGLTHGSQFTSQPLTETGTQTDQQIHSTALTAERLLNSATSLDFGLNQNINLTPGYQDSYDWSTLDWLSYEFWPRLNAGIGAGGGFTEVNVGANQAYEQLQARVNWRATDKISFQISGGVEDRQFLSGQPFTNSVSYTTNGINSSLAHPDSDLLTPTFNATIQYLPFKHTQITISASRLVAPSLFPGSDTTYTSFGANISQQLFKKFQLNVGGSYNISKFTETTSAITLSPNEIRFALENSGRTDDTVSFNVRLSHPFLKRGTWSVFYQYSDNRSTEPGFSYQSNQTGFEISYSY